MAGGPRVIVYTREGCHLCEDARVVCAQICEEHQERFQVVDVDSDPQLRQRFTDHVPVTVVDGNIVSYWHLDPDVLRAALSEPPGTQRGMPGL